MAKNKKKTFSEKYPPLDKGGIKDEIEGQKTAKTVYAANAMEIEKNFTEFNKVLDPIYGQLPDGKKATIALVHRPKMRQIRALIPPEMAKYIAKGENPPEELEKKYAKFIYQKMAELIAVPEKTAEEWEEDSNPWFLNKFWKHIADIQTLIEGQSEGF